MEICMTMSCCTTTSLRRVIMTIVMTTALFVSSSISTRPALAQYNDILGFQIISDRQDYMVVGVDYYYDGSFGPGWLAVIPLVGGSSAATYYAGSHCSNNNAIQSGQHWICLALGIPQGAPNQFSTDAVKICLFGGPREYCETFPLVKQWSLAGPAYLVAESQPSGAMVYCGFKGRDGILDTNSGRMLGYTPLRAAVLPSDVSVRRNGQANLTCELRIPGYVPYQVVMALGYRGSIQPGKIYQIRASLRRP